MYRPTHRITALVLAISGLVGLNSCEIQEPAQLSSSNIYVLHGGRGGHASASLSRINEAGPVVENQIHPGPYPNVQSNRRLTISSEFGYLCSFPQGLIKFDISSGTIVGEFGSGSNYFFEDVILVNETLACAASLDQIYQFNPEQMIIEDSVNLGSRSFDLLAVGGDIWIATKDMIHKYDFGTNQITQSLNVGAGGKSMVQDVNGDIWVLTTSYDAIDVSLNRINQIDMSVEQSFTLTNPDSIYGWQMFPLELAIDGSRTILYWVNFDWDFNVFRMPINASILPENPFIQTRAHGVGIDPVSGRIFTSSRGQNQSFTGFVNSYDHFGVPLDTFQVTDGPFRFYFDAEN